MKKLLSIVCAMCISMALMPTLSFADQSTSSQQIQKIMSVSDPAQRLKTLKQTLKSLSDPKVRAQFMRDYLAEKNKNNISNPSSSSNNINVSQLSFPYIKTVSNKKHLIFKGKDYGEIDRDTSSIAFSDTSIASKKFIKGQYHIILNGKDLGEGGYYKLSHDNFVYTTKDHHIIFNDKDFGVTNYDCFKISGNNIIFTRFINKGYHLIFNGEDLGETVECGVLYENNVAYLKKVGNKNHVFFNKTDLGEGSEIRMSKNNFAYINKDGHVMFNGKDLGKGSDIQISGDNIAFLNNQEHVIVNGKDLGKPNQGISNDYGRFILSGDNVVYFHIIGIEQHIIFNGKDMGKGHSPKIEGNNIAFLRTVEDNSSPGLISEVTHIIFNGKDYGEISGSDNGYYFDMSGNNFVYINQDGNTILNGTDLGKIGSLAFVTEGVLYEKEVGNKTHLILNGTDIGEGVFFRSTEIINITPFYQYFND